MLGTNSPRQLTLFVVKDISDVTKKKMALFMAKDINYATITWQKHEIVFFQNWVHNIGILYCVVVDFFLHFIFNTIIESYVQWSLSTKLMLYWLPNFDTLVASLIWQVRQEKIWSVLYRNLYCNAAKLLNKILWKIPIILIFLKKTKILSQKRLWKPLCRLFS